MNTQIGQTTIGELLPYIIVLTMILAFLVLCVITIIKTSRLKKERKGKDKELKEKGLTHRLAATHTYGLPIAEGVFCDIQAYGDHIEFLSGATHVNLNLNKITDICIKSEADIRQQYMSSVGGAVGGAMLFGPIGAMIGGRTKKKTDKIIYSYLIITYRNSDGKPEYLGFDVSSCSWQAAKLANDFRKHNAGSEVCVEL